jgi:hypothetical protein
VIDQTAAVALTTATHVDVPGLAFQMYEDVEYVIEGVVAAVASAAGADVQASVSGVTGLTGKWTWWTQPVTDEAFIPTPEGEILAAGGTQAVTESPVTDIAANTDVGYIKFEATISNDADGVFQIQAGQGTDSGTTTVDHSRMTVRQVQTS